MQVTEVLSQLRIPFLTEGNHHCRPGWVQTDCPFCGPGSGRFHLGWNLRVGYTNCWKCGGHSPFAVFRQLGLSPGRAREVAGWITADRSPKPHTEAASYQKPGSVGRLLPPHRRYLRSRGFDPAQVARIWGVGGIGVAGRLSWRLFIPITYNGDEVSWTTRSIAQDVRQRYISASAKQEAVNHKTLVYGQDHCFHSVVIVEGPLDAWKVGPGAGALFGTAYTPAQVKRLVRHPNRYVCFDSSPDAQAQAERLVDELSCFEGVTENIVLDAEDPGSAPERELRLLRKHTRI